MFSPTGKATIRHEYSRCSRRGLRLAVLFAGATCILLATVSCGWLESLAPKEGPIAEGATFEYTAWATEVAPALKGTIEILSVDSNSFTGIWAISWAPDADTTQRVGPQIGTGVLKGVLYGGQLGADLSSSDSAEAVRLIATPDGAGWSGRWYYARVGPSALRIQGQMTARRSALLPG